MISRRQFLTAATVGVASSLFTNVALAQVNRVVCPILMYHYISTPPADANATLVDLAVPPELFGVHLDTLQQAGFTTITMRQLWAGMTGAAALPAKPCVLTFDDGYWDAYAHAVPALLQRGMTGTIYLVSRYMEQAGYLTWGQAAELQNAGIEMGCHSATHQNMTAMSAPDQRWDIEESTTAIETTLGVRPTSFCYPFGKFTVDTVRALQKFGYTTAVTTSDATVVYRSNPYRMGRVRVRNSTTPEKLLVLANRQNG